MTAEAWVPGSFTGREWLMAVGRLYDIEALRLMDHVDRLLELFDLTEKGDSTVSAYSSGQKRKIALASVLVTDAPVLLLDEPFAGGLDPSGIAALKRVLLGLTRKQKVTVVMATPVPELVAELADRIAVIREGQLVACDTVDGLRAIAGGGNNLDDIYERLASPKRVSNVERYFEGGVA